MDFRLTAEQQAYEKTFSDWLSGNLPDALDPQGSGHFETDEAWGLAYRAFQKTLFEAGYAGVHYPLEYGGQGMGMIENVIISRVLATACNELRIPGSITFGMAAPTIHIVGTEEQKREFLPKMLDGAHIWCQGFSEPNAGSDVANIGTSAVRDGEHFVINGRKIWTSFAHLADYCMLLVRTDPGAAKHRGLSYLLMDMNLPGVEVRPIRQLTAESHFNEVFMEDVRIPVDMLVGGEGNGWRIAITTLMFERVMGDATMAATYSASLVRLFEMAGTTKRSGRPVIEDPLFRQELARAYVDVQVLRCHGLRSLSHMVSGGVPGPEGSIGKLLWSLAYQRFSEAALNMQGPGGQVMGGSPRSIQAGLWQHEFLMSKGGTIAAGTTEINKNIIGERVLGLPKDGSRASRG
ncbi:MAG: acyl-CoA dehydrogenase family protein [Proteobacteria bacterium]|nr:acyl-CoA dehydrogenase family protein [Pseudomonadota bacterium]